MLPSSTPPTTPTRPTDGRARSELSDVSGMSEVPRETIERIKRSVDLVDLVGQEAKILLKRTASTHKGEYHGPCPWCGGSDRFAVWPNADPPRYWCRGCSKSGDAISFIRELRGLPFSEAIEYLAPIETSRLAVERHDEPGPWVIRPASVPGDYWIESARELVAHAADQLWSESGGEAQRFLAGRGLTDRTLKDYLIGYEPEAIQVRELWCPSGILIPWFADGNVVHIKVRFLDADQRYGSISGGRPTVFGSPARSATGNVVLLEGEFDSMLLAQEAGEWIQAIAAGSAVSRPNRHVHDALASAERAFVSYDGDDAGKAAAAALVGAIPTATILEIPAGYKDATDLYLAGGDLRRWVRWGLYRAQSEASRALSI